MSKAKLLIVSYYYPPVGGLGLPGAQRTIKFVRNFHELEVHVLTVKTSDYAPYLDLNYRKKLPINGEKIYRTSTHDYFGAVLRARSFVRSLGRKGTGHTPNIGEGVPAIREESPVDDSTSKRIKDFVHDVCYFPDVASGWIVPAVVSGLRVIMKEKIEIVLATGMPWSALVIAYLLHKLTGIAYVVDFRDPWIGNPFNRSKGKFLDGWSNRLERQVVHHASLVCANTKPLMEEFFARYPELGKEKFCVLPNGYDLDDFQDLEISNRPGSHRLGLTLAHAGYIYGKRDPGPLVDALEMLRKQEEDLKGKFKFLQMGRVELDYDFLQRYRSMIADGTIELTGILPYRECLRRQIESDVLILIQPGTKTQVPSKLYDYLCLKRPILTIAPPDGALGRVIREYGFGELFDPSDVEGMARKLREFYQIKNSRGSLETEYPLEGEFDAVRISARLEERLIRILRSSSRSRAEALSPTAGTSN